MEVILDGSRYSFDRKEIRQFTLANLNSYGSLEFSGNHRFLFCLSYARSISRETLPQASPIRIVGSPMLHIILRSQEQPIIGGFLKWGIPKSPKVSILAL